MWLARLCILAIAVFAAAPAQKPANMADAIAKIRVEWTKKLHDKQLDQFVLLYAPDAVFLTPNGGRFTGRRAIRDLTQNAMDTFTSNLTFHSITADDSADLAYDSGEFHETLVKLSDGTTSEGNGNYLMVFKRQKDGNWLIVQQVWTQSLAAHQ